MEVLAQSLHFPAEIVDLVLQIIVIFVATEDDHNDGDEDESSASERGSDFLGLGHGYK